MKKYISVSIVIILLIINFLLIKNASFGQVKDLEGQIRTVREVEIAALKTLFIGMPLISLFLGSILSLFRSKQKRNIIYCSMIILIVFYSCILILGVRNIILW